MVDCILYYLVDDTWIFSRFVRLHETYKEISKSTNEYVSQQNGLKLRKPNRAEISDLTKKWKLYEGLSMIIQKILFDVYFLLIAIR